MRIANGIPWDSVHPMPVKGANLPLYHGLKRRRANVAVRKGIIQQHRVYERLHDLLVIALESFQYLQKAIHHRNLEVKAKRPIITPPTPR